MQDYKDEMSMKQWLALLLRTREARQRPKGGVQEEDTQAPRLELQSPACRLEELKRGRHAGDSKGEVPPQSEDGKEGPPG